MKNNPDAKRFSTYQSVIKVLTTKDPFRKPDIYAVLEADYMPIFTREGGSWAELYEVETAQLKRAVRRNIDRFPDDFMFDLTRKELDNWRCQFGTSNRDKMGLRHKPMAFTEQGVAMLSSVLRSKRAIHVNIQIMRVFTKLRQMVLENKLMNGFRLYLKPWTSC